MAFALAVALVCPSLAEAGTPYYQWQFSLGNSQAGTAWVSGWQADAESVCALGQTAAQANPARIGFNTSGTFAFRNWSHVLVPNTFPYYGCNITAEYLRTPCPSGWICDWSPIQSGALAMAPRANTGWYFVIAPLPPSLLPAQCRTCIADPVNPVSGAVFETEVDAHEQGGAPPFKRFYNSTNLSSGVLGMGWQHSFSARIDPRYSVVKYQPYVSGSPDNSSLYNDPASACTVGFPEIKARVSTWQNATASYNNGTCTLSVGATNIGTLPVLYSSSQLPAPLSIVVGFDATREDGQLVSFTFYGGTIVSPPSIPLKLQQTSGGYTLTDESDNVETYDANGKLLSVTSRAGVVDTISYDSSGRLSRVTDSFGHGLSLSYDSQGHLSSMTRQ